MARTALAAQTIPEAGLTPAYTAANVDGHACSPGRTILHVKNGSGVSINVTVQTGALFHGRAVGDDVVAVPAGAERLIALNNRELLGRPTPPDIGLCWVDFSAVTSVTVALFAH